MAKLKEFISRTLNETLDVTIDEIKDEILKADQTIIEEEDFR